MKNHSTRHATRCRLAIAASIAALFLANPALPDARAAIKTSTDVDGSFWNNTASWTTTGIPVIGDDVYLGTTSAAASNVTVNFNGNYTGVGLDSLTFNATGISGTSTLS